MYCTDDHMIKNLSGVTEILEGDEVTEGSVKHPMFLPLFKGFQSFMGEGVRKYSSPHSVCILIKKISSNHAKDVLLCRPLDFSMLN